MLPTPLGRVTYFTESINSNVNLVQKHPHRHTQKQRLDKYLGNLWPSQVDTTLMITLPLLKTGAKIPQTRIQECEDVGTLILVDSIRQLQYVFIMSVKCHS